MVDQTHFSLFKKTRSKLKKAFSSLNLILFESKTSICFGQSTGHLTGPGPIPGRINTQSGYFYCIRENRKFRLEISMALMFFERVQIFRVRDLGEERQETSITQH